jgi:hypothetical protein
MISAHRGPCESTGCCNGSRSICDWPVEVEVTIPAIQANVGDPWITAYKKKRGEIVQIEYFYHDGVTPAVERRWGVRLTIWVKLPGRPHPYPYHRVRFGGAGVPTLRLAPCGRHACENHVREVSDTRHYCQAHWHSWENV